MKTLQTLRNASMATLAVAALSVPTLAHATDRAYSKQSQICKSDEGEARLIGGLLGAVVGGVVGSEIAGHGDRNEGAVIGALIGGLAGAGIGDESVNCDKRRSRGFSNASYKQAPLRRGYAYKGATYRNGYQNTYPVGYSNRRFDDRRDFGHRKISDRRDDTRAQLADVRYRLADLQRESRKLERRLYRNYSRKTERRLDRVCDEIERLERKERRFERRLRKRNNRY